MSISVRRAKHLIKSTWTIQSRRGVTYWAYLITGYLIPKAAYHSINGPLRLRPRKVLRLAVLLFGVLTASVILILGILTTFSKSLLIILLFALVSLGGAVVFRRINLLRTRRLARNLTEKAKSNYLAGTFTSWRHLPIKDDVRKAIEETRKETPQREIVIGHIDNDGRVLGLFGDIPGLPSVSKAEFLKRKRFGVDIVLIEDSLLVRKDYRGQENRFLSEWLTLAILSGKANVPAIHHVDEKNFRIYKNLILGKTIREFLVDAGAKIMHAQTKEDPELMRLDDAARLLAVVRRGTSLVSSVLPDSLLCEIECQMNLIHSSLVTNFSNTFGNIVIDTEKGAPWFIDLEGAVSHRSTSELAFIFRRDIDQVKFNERYGRTLLTESSARAALHSQSVRLPGWYSPIDFGSGLAIGGFWSTDSGIGRWEFLNCKIMAPIIEGKKVLDLGSNNGLMPLLMLRAGAREVVGVELSAVNVESAKLIQRIFEWRDMRSYKLHIHNANMLEVLNAEWGKFDVVTSLCSLYYLEPDEMASIVRRAANLAPVMIIQANVATRKEAAQQKSEKASTKFLKQLLVDNGFPYVEVYAPEGFSRPILVGRSASHLGELAFSRHHAGLSKEDYSYVNSTTSNFTLTSSSSAQK